MYKSTMYHRRYDNITNIQNWYRSTMYHGRYCIITKIQNTYRSTMYHGRYDTITVLQTLSAIHRHCQTTDLQTSVNNCITDIVKQLIYRHE